MSEIHPSAPPAAQGDIGAVTDRRPMIAYARAWSDKDPDTREKMATRTVLRALDKVEHDWANREADVMRLSVALEDAERNRALDAAKIASLKENGAFVMRGDAKEIIALRARVEALTEALREAREWVQASHDDLADPSGAKVALARIDAALADKELEMSDEWDEKALALSLVCESYEKGSCTDPKTGEQMEPCYCAAVAAALREAYERGMRRQALDALAKLDGETL